MFQSFERARKDTDPCGPQHLVAAECQIIAPQVCDIYFCMRDRLRGIDTSQDTPVSCELTNIPDRIDDVRHIGSVASGQHLGFFPIQRLCDDRGSSGSTGFCGIQAKDDCRIHGRMFEWCSPVVGKTLSFGVRPRPFATMLIASVAFLTKTTAEDGTDRKRARVLRAASYASEASSDNLCFPRWTLAVNQVEYSCSWKARRKASMMSRQNRDRRVACRR